MSKLSMLNLYLIFKTTNLRPVYDFLKEIDGFDFKSRELKIDHKEAVKQYKDWKKAKRRHTDLVMMLEGRKGRPKKVKQAVN